MCRIALYLGEPVTLASLVLEPDHSLRRQSYAPKHQPQGRLNADGFGVGWYAPDARREPAVYRTVMPIWHDATFASIAGAISSGAILAALRAATPGFPIDITSTQPFASGPWLFTHNGSVDGFRDGVGEQLRRALTPARASEIASAVDSAVLFAMALDRLDRGMSAGDALAGVVADVKQAGGGRLNLALTDGTRFAATSFGNSLFVRDDAAVVVASEPLDDDGAWREVPDLSLVEGDATSVAVTPL